VQAHSRQRSGGNCGSGSAAAPAHLSAAQIVEKNVAARCSCRVHGVRTMIMKGQDGRGRNLL